MNTKVTNGNVQRRIKNRPGRPKGSPNKKTRYIREFQLNVADIKTADHASSDLLLHSRCPNYFPRAPRIRLKRLNHGDRNGSRNALSLLKSQLFYPNGNLLEKSEENNSYDKQKEKGENWDDISGKIEKACAENNLKDALPLNLITDKDVSKLKITLKNFVPSRLVATSVNNCSHNQSCKPSENIDVSCKLNNTLGIDNESIDHNSYLNEDKSNENTEKNDAVGISDHMNPSCDQHDTIIEGTGELMPSAAHGRNLDNSSSDLPVLSNETDNESNANDENCPPLLLPEESIDVSDATHEAVNKWNESLDNDSNRPINVSTRDIISLETNNESTNVANTNVEESFQSNNTEIITSGNDVDNNSNEVVTETSSEPTDLVTDKIITNAEAEKNKKTEFEEFGTNTNKQTKVKSVNRPKSKMQETSCLKNKSMKIIKQEQEEITRKPLYQHDGYDSDATVIYDEEDERRQKSKRKNGSVCSPAKIKQTQELLRQRSKSISLDSDRQTTVKTPETMECLESLYPYRGDNIDKSEDMSSVAEVSDNEENRLLIDDNDEGTKCIKTEPLKVKIIKNSKNKIKKINDTNGAKNRSPKEKAASGFKLSSSKWDQALTSCDSVMFTDMTISRNILKKSLKGKNGKIVKPNKERSERTKREQNQDNVLKNINKIFPKPRRKRSKDEDDLPTILPPKRRRQEKSKAATDNKGGIERINQEFPRFNWLEKKYTDAQIKKQPESGQQAKVSSDSAVIPAVEHCTDKVMSQSIEHTDNAQILSNETGESEQTVPLNSAPETTENVDSSVEQPLCLAAPPLDVDKTAEMTHNTIIDDRCNVESSVSESGGTNNEDILEKQTDDDEIMAAPEDNTDEVIQEHPNDLADVTIQSTATDTIMIEENAATEPNNINNYIEGEQEYSTTDERSEMTMVVHENQTQNMDITEAPAMANLNCNIHQESGENSQKTLQVESEKSLPSNETSDNIESNTESDNGNCLTETQESNGNKSPEEGLIQHPINITGDVDKTVDTQNVPADLSCVNEDTPMDSSEKQNTTTSPIIIQSDKSVVSSEPDKVNDEPEPKKFRHGGHLNSQTAAKNIPPLVPVTSVSKTNKTGNKVSHNLGLGPEVDATYNEIKELKRKIDILQRETEKFQVALKQKEELLRALLLSCPLAPSRQTQPLAEARKPEKPAPLSLSMTDRKKEEKPNKHSFTEHVISKHESKVPPPAHSGNKKENTREILKVMEENPVNQLRRPWSSRQRPLSPPLQFKNKISPIPNVHAHTQKPFEQTGVNSHKPERSKSQGNDSVGNIRIETSRAVSAPLQDKIHSSPMNLQHKADQIVPPMSGMFTPKGTGNPNVSMVSPVSRSSAMSNTIVQNALSPKSLRIQSSSLGGKSTENKIQHELNEAVKRRQKTEPAKSDVQDYQQFKIAKPESTGHRQQYIAMQPMIENSPKQTPMHTPMQQQSPIPVQRQSMQQVPVLKQHPPPYPGKAISTTQKTSQHPENAINGRNISTVASSFPHFSQLPQSVRLIGAATIPSSQINRPNEQVKGNPVPMIQQHISHPQPNAVPMSHGQYIPRAIGHTQQGVVSPGVQMIPSGMVPVPRPRLPMEVSSPYPHQVNVPMQQNVPRNPVFQQVALRHPQINKGIHPDHSNVDRQNQVAPVAQQNSHTVHPQSIPRDQSGQRGMHIGQQQTKPAVAHETGGKTQHIFGNCILCGKFSLYLCSTCQDVWYCSQQCQLKHWTTHQHECKYSAK